MKRMHLKTSLVLMMTAAAFLLGSCEKDQVNINEGPSFTPTAKQKAVVQASNYFGFNMLRKSIEHGGDSNICISPMSISTALGMTWCGADGSTATQMENTLGFQGMSQNDIKEAYKGLIKYLLEADPAVKLEIANSIWHRDDFFVEPNFIQDNQYYFSSAIYPVDFTAPQTVHQINQWVSDATHGKIDEIIDVIPPDIVMYLINALYFKADWTTSFDASKTHTAIFQSPQGNINVDMMEKQDKIMVLQNQHCNAVKLPYGDGRFSFVAMLPADGKNMDELVSNLDQQNWSDWMQNFNEHEDFLLYLPKFKLEFEKNLNNMLVDLGMEDAFSPTLADFSNINPNAQLFISEVKHKTYIDVNEKGTEAAAVTSVAVGFGSVDMMIFNREFLFFIIEENTGFVMFSGRINQPEYN